MDDRARDLGRRGECAAVHFHRQLGLAPPLRQDGKAAIGIAIGFGDDPLGDLELELVGPNRKVAATMKSSSDGYYVIPAVFPGLYLLRIAPAQLTAIDSRPDSIS